MFTTNPNGVIYAHTAATAAAQLGDTNMNALIIAVGILNNRALTGSTAEEIIAAFRLLGISDQAAPVINSLITFGH